MSDTPQQPTAARRRNAVKAPPPVDSTPAETAGPERIAKVMARAGLCSRRDAEAWIKERRVAVNGTVLTSPALNVGPDDRITVDGQPVTTRERTRLFLYHKPRGLVTTARDPEGRPTVFEAMPEGLPRVVSIGRLDINTEGLLLLTNDGGLARVLELPATGWLRRYRVRANGFVTQDKLESLKEGITIDGVDYAGIEAALDRTQGANQWLTMGLREGKNREIKRVLEHLGLAVNRLIRLSFGPFQLGELEEGAVEEVRPRVLKDQLGDALAAQAGVIWEDAVQAEVVTAAVTERKATRQRRDPPGPTSARPDPTRSTKGRDRDREDVQERPRQDRPAPRARPHVSALRTEAKATGDGPRKKISRRTTEDRSGRTVKVERVSVDGKDWHRSGEGGTSRNARNFARERREAETADAAPSTGRPRTRSAPAQRAGGFSSERPLTGRALKDGKVRRPAPRSDGGGSPRAGGQGASPRNQGASPRSQGQRPGGQGPRPGGGKPRGGSGGPSGSGRPRGRS